MNCGHSDSVSVSFSSGIQRIVLESDSQVLTKMWQEDNFSRSQVASILGEIKEICRVFTCFSQSVHRTANVAAHLCAKHGANAKQGTSLAELLPKLYL